MITSLWGLTVGDLFRSRVYGTARTYRVLAIHDQQATIAVDGTPRRYAKVHAEVLPEPQRGHARGDAWLTILDSDGDPLELGGWGRWQAVPITMIQHAPVRPVQLGLFEVPS